MTDTVDLSRLTEEERAIFERSKDDRDKIVGSEVRWILSRLVQARADCDFHEREERERNQQALGLQEKLTQARAVVEAAREVEAAFTRRPRAAPLRPVIEKLIAAVRSHDAEAR